MALVLLVVVGHSWTLLPHTALNDHLYDFLYAWHVPAFVLVTGYLSRSFAWSATGMWQLVRTVVVPYVLFECAWRCSASTSAARSWTTCSRDPHWPMWYLSALFFWRLLTPVFRPMSGPRRVAVAVVIAWWPASTPATPWTWLGFSACCRSSCWG